MMIWIFIELPLQYIMRNAMSTIFSEQILSDRLLLAIMSGQKSNLSCGFKLEV